MRDAFIILLVGCVFAISLLLMTACVTPGQRCSELKLKHQDVMTKCHIDIADEMRAEQLDPKNLKPTIDEICEKQNPGPRCE